MVAAKEGRSKEAGKRSEGERCRKRPLGRKRAKRFPQGTWGLRVVASAHQDKIAQHDRLIPDLRLHVEFRGPMEGDDWWAAQRLSPSW